METAWALVGCLDVLFRHVEMNLKKKKAFTLTNLNVIIEDSPAHTPPAFVLFYLLIFLLVSYAHMLCWLLFPPITIQSRNAIQPHLYSNCIPTTHTYPPHPAIAPLWNLIAKTTWQYLRETNPPRQLCSVPALRYGTLLISLCTSAGSRINKWHQEKGCR